MASIAVPTNELFVPNCINSSTGNLSQAGSNDNHQHDNRDSLSGGKGRSSNNSNSNRNNNNNNNNSNQQQQLQQLQQPPQKISNQNSQVVGAITASIRAFTYQISSLYLRTPVKLFRPSRFDYMAYTRLALFHEENVANLSQGAQHNPVYKAAAAGQPNVKYNFFKHSSIALLVQAVQRHGWKFIPDNVLPPLLANSFTGLVLYTSYLTTLNSYASKNQEYSIRPNTNILEPRVLDTFRAGMIAGALQSLVAAPIDAIYTRSSTAELLSQKHDNLWKYGVYKLRNIGLIGVFAGFGVSLVKESVGFAFYFSTFELIKNQAFNKTVNFINGCRNFKYKYLGFVFKGEPKNLIDENAKFKVLKSTYILAAGASAATVLQVIQFPLSKIQNIHLSRLEALDYYNLQVPEYKTPTYNANRYRLVKGVETLPNMMRPLAHRVNENAFLVKYWTRRVLNNPFLNVYYKSYLETLTTILTIQQNKNLTWWQWSYKGFTRYVLTTIPATSIGLLVFEIMRSKLSDTVDELTLEP